jgi:hypothetical protein
MGKEFEGSTYRLGNRRFIDTERLETRVYKYSINGDLGLGRLRMIGKSVSDVGYNAARQPLTQNSPRNGHVAGLHQPQRCAPSNIDYT